MSAFSLTLRLTRSGASWSDANDAHTEAFSEGGAYDSVGLSIYEMINTQISEGKLTRSVSLENPAVLKVDYTWDDDEDFKKYLQHAIEKKTGQQADPIRKRTPRGTWVTDISQSRALDASFKDLSNLVTAD